MYVYVLCMGMCMCQCLCMCMCLRMHISTCAAFYAHVFLSVHVYGICMCVHGHVYVLVHVHVYVCMSMVALPACIASHLPCYYLLGISNDWGHSDPIWTNFSSNQLYSTTCVSVRSEQQDDPRSLKFSLGTFPLLISMLKEASNSASPGESCCS